MGDPTTRYQTFAVGDVIPLEFLNDWVQDHIIDLRADVDSTEAERVGPWLIGPFDFQADGVSGPDLRTAGTGSAPTKKWTVYANGTSAVEFYAPLPVPHGRGMSAWEIQTNRVTAGGTFGVEILRIAADGTETILSTINVGATLGDQTTTASHAHTFDTRAYAYYVRLKITNPSGGGDCRLYSIEITPA